MKKQLKYFVSIIVVLFIIDSCEDEQENKEPTCSIVTPTSRTEITKGDVVTISVDAEDQDGDLAEVRFYIDDIGIGSAVNFPYNYTWNTNETTTGSHTIRVEAIDSKQAKSEDQVTITIDGISPIADFIVSNTIITLGESVDFTDQSTNNPTSWNWDFGDGNTSTSQNPTHTYSSKGTYTVELTVSNNYGSNTETKSDCIAVISTPTITTSPATGITEESAIVGGNIIDDGGTSIIERGIYYSTSSNPESTGMKIQIGSGTGSFSETIEGLDENTLYYVKAYAQNSEGAIYGNKISFITNQKPELPTVILDDFTEYNITWFNANGEVTDSGGLYISDRGFVYNNVGNPDFNDTKVSCGSGTGIFTFSFTSMPTNTTYYIRSYATNALGIAYSNEKTVSLQANLPIVNTFEATDITLTSAIVGGEVTDDGGVNVIERGVYYGTSSNPESSGVKFQISSGIGNFSEMIAGLSANTTYFIKAYAINSEGISYGGETIFNTLRETGTVIDYDGNVYNTVKIGNKWWMTENLKTTHYGDGTEITLVENDLDWEALGDIDKAMCYYNNNTNNEFDIYGALYTWAAAMNGSASSSANPSGVQGACPDGWHMPSDAEWKELEMSLGMSQTEADDENGRGTNEGSKLAGNETLWSDGQLDSDIEFGTSGFLALPGGSRYFGASFNYLTYQAYFWSATEGDYSDIAWGRTLSGRYSDVYREELTKTIGASVRCIKD